MDQNLRYNCSRCNYVAGSFSLILKHYRHIHAHEPGFFVACRVEDCPKTYTNIQSLYCHIRRKHKVFASQHFTNMAMEPNMSFLDHVPEESDANEAEPAQMEVENADPVPNQLGDLCPQVAATDYDYDRNHALFLFDLKELNKVPQSACTAISNHMQSVLELNNQQLAKKLQDIIQVNGQLTDEDIETAVRSQNSSSAGACDRLSSEYKLQKYASYHFNTVDAVEMILGHDPHTHVEHTMQYVPVLKSLNQLLSHEDVLAEVNTNRQSTDGKLRDYCDGSIYRNNPIFQRFPNAIQLEFYNDDFTVTNPLNYRSRKYKISAIYYILTNLSPKHRSRLDLIQLVSLAKATHVKQHGLPALIEPALEDMKHLEQNGITVTFENGDQHFIGTISFTAADNLAAHFLGGFFENFSTVLRLCRTCNVTKHNISTLFNETDFQLRTKAAYDQQATLAEADETLAAQYGIKRKSPLNELEYYHVIDGLPPDLAHDLFEGVMPDLFTYVILSLVDDDHITLQQFQKRVNNFRYLDTDKVNQPAVLTIVNFKLKFTQSQMWCFGRLLPLIIADRVPEGHAAWQLVLDFLDILDIVCAICASEEDLVYLSCLITDFLRSFITVYPDKKIKPKWHYLIHYPTNIRKFGPLVYCWTMRLEGKHDFFKQVCLRSKNKKNVCQTMAKRHQSRQALINAKKDILGQEEMPCIGVKQKKVDSLEENVRLLVEPLIGSKEEVQSVRKVKVHGTQYCVGSVVVLDERYDEYEFGCIDHIFMINSSPYLCCSLLEIDQFDQHHHAYVVTNTGCLVIKQVRDLLDYHPLGLYNVRNKNYVVIRYNMSK